MMVQDVEQLFGPEVEVAEEEVPTIVVVTGRGDNAERHEFPFTDISDDPFIPDDELKELVEEYMDGVVAPGELADKKVVRAEGNVVISQANVYGAYQDRNKGELLESATKNGKTRAFSQEERRRLNELEKKGLLDYESYDTYKPTRKVDG